MDATIPEALPTLDLVGDNQTLIWGMTSEERMRRIAVARGLPVALGGDATPTLLADLAFAFDPAWVGHLLRHPGAVLTCGGRPVLAHARDSAQAAAVRRAMERGEALAAGTGLDEIRAEDERGILNEELRKRERPFVLPLRPDTVAAIERASYSGAYKGVTDLLTKYLWPGLAFHLTRLAAALGMTPNQVTALGSAFCVIATVAFWHGWFWSGMATGFAFMVLDTVDGKLARCTITSSRLGHLWDHGVDLVHPLFWWWAWAVGCMAYGRPLDEPVFWATIGVIVFGYVAQRLIEGAFIVRFGMHIHVWERFDSRFRLVTARRNPNMVLLFASLLIGRPDWGIVAVAAWTALSLVVHLARLLQAIARRRRGGAITSWLA